MRNFPRISRRTISLSSLSHPKVKARAAERAKARSLIPIAMMSLWEWARASRISDRIFPGSGSNRRKEESPGSTGRWCWLTARSGNATESAAENRPPTGKGETAV